MVFEAAIAKEVSGRRQWRDDMAVAAAAATTDLVSTGFGECNRGNGDVVGIDGECFPAVPTIETIEIKTDRATIATEADDAPDILTGRFAAVSKEAEHIANTAVGSAVVTDRLGGEATGSLPASIGRFKAFAGEHQAETAGIEVIDGIGLIACWRIKGATKAEFEV